MVRELQVLMMMEAIIVVLLMRCVYKVVGMPPEDVIRCSSNNRNCTVTNYIGIFPDRSLCRASEVTFPTTEQELVSIVAEASRTNTSMKAASRFVHSIPKLVCPRGQNGLIISTKKLNKILKINVKGRTMTVESGATLRGIIRSAATEGLALPHTPFWWDLTIGGVIATGAHGSSLWGKGGAVHEHVIGLRMVSPDGPEQGYARVRTLGQSDEDLNAGKVSLGVLGVVSRVTLKLEPMFKRSVTLLRKNDSDLGDEVVRFGKENEFGDIIWYRSQRKTVYRVDQRVSVDTSGNGTFDFLQFRPKLPTELVAFRAAEEAVEATGYAYGKCVVAKALIKMLNNDAYGFTNNGKTFTGCPVIGFNNHMQASGTCLTRTEDDEEDKEEEEDSTVCPWDSRFNVRFYHQIAFSIPLSSAKPFISDIKKIVELEPHAFCGLDLYNGILIRYIRASSAYLGKPKDSVEFDLTYYRRKDPFTPRLHQDIFDEIEQMGLVKYGGVPHWGKNRNMAFGGVMRKYPNAGKFLKVKEAFDPKGLFSSEWSDIMLEIKEEEENVGFLKEGCALEGLCVCSQDSHCAPSKGYFCRVGRIYKEAKVCAFDQYHSLEKAYDLKDDL